MNRNQHKHKRMVATTRHSAVLIGLVAFLAAGQHARADSSCIGFLAAKKDAAIQYNQSYIVELTMHREGIKLVSYSAGYLTPKQNGSFSGASNQLFSDRTNNGQLFDVNQVDSLELNLSPTGLLHIYYRTWNFDTTWDLSCKGAMMTKYVPYHGIVTLTFREAFYNDIIQ